MRKLQTVLRDLLLALVLGLGIGLALGAVLWGVGTLAGGAANGLETARSGLMLAGGFTLLFGGILLLKGDSLPKQAFQLRPRPQQEDAPDRPRPPGCSGRQTGAIPRCFWERASCWCRRRQTIWCAWGR